MEGEDEPVCKGPELESHHFNHNSRVKQEQAVPELQGRDCIPPAGLNSQTNLVSSQTMPHSYQKELEYSTDTCSDQRQMVHEQQNSEPLSTGRKQNSAMTPSPKVQKPSSLSMPWPESGLLGHDPFQNFTREIALRQSPPLGDTQHNLVESGRGMKDELKEKVDINPRTIKFTKGWCTRIGCVYYTL